MRQQICFLCADLQHENASISLLTSPPKPTDCRSSKTFLRRASLRGYFLTTFLKNFSTAGSTGFSFSTNDDVLFLLNEPLFGRKKSSDEISAIETYTPIVSASALCLSSQCILLQELPLLVVHIYVVRIELAAVVRRVTPKVSGRTIPRVLFNLNEVENIR